MFHYNKINKKNITSGLSNKHMYYFLIISDINLGGVLLLLALMYGGIKHRKCVASQA